MSQAKEITPLIDQLETILGSGDLSAPYDRWGARLLAHLTRPVQVVVTGLAGTGKSALIEMLSGRPVLGHRPGAPMTELIHGESARVIFERADGALRRVDGHLRDHVVPDGVCRICQELPEPALLQQSFIEISVAGPPERKATLLEQVATRADIVIWCTQEFGAEEHALWSAMPDAIKDHSLMALTMADRQMMRGSLQATIDRLHPIVAEEFLGLYPVATIQGITAFQAGPEPDNALWSSSGGRHLMESLGRQIAQGRAVDNDRAQIFLDRIDARRNKAPQALMAPSSPTTDRMATGQADDTPPPEHVAETAPALMAEATVATEQTSETMAVISRALALLQDSAGRMLDTLDPDTELDCDAIMGGCSQAMASLSDLLGRVSSDDEATHALREDVEEGEEMLMLFQLERGEEAALDAATLLLQIRKDLIEKAAS